MDEKTTHSDEQIGTDSFNWEGLDEMDDPFNWRKKAFEVLGGHNAFAGGRIDEPPYQFPSLIRWVSLIEEGFPTDTLSALHENTDLRSEEIEGAALLSSSLEDRLKDDRLTTLESDRTLQIARVLVVTWETFGNKEKAVRWLRTTSWDIAEQPPLHYLGTQTGTDLVLQTLGRIEHGVYF